MTLSRGTFADALDRDGWALEGTNALTLGHVVSVNRVNATTAVLTVVGAAVNNEVYLLVVDDDQFGPGTDTFLTRQHVRVLPMITPQMSAHILTGTNQVLLSLSGDARFSPAVVSLNFTLDGTDRDFIPAGFERLSDTTLLISVGGGNVQLADPIHLFRISAHADAFAAGVGAVTGVIPTIGPRQNVVARASVTEGSRLITVEFDPVGVLAAGFTPANWLMDGPDGGMMNPLAGGTGTGRISGTEIRFLLNTPAQAGHSLTIMPTQAAVHSLFLPPTAPIPVIINPAADNPAVALSANIVAGSDVIQLVVTGPGGADIFADNDAFRDFSNWTLGGANQAELGTIFAVERVTGRIARLLTTGFAVTGSVYTITAVDDVFVAAWSNFAEPVAVDVIASRAATANATGSTAAATVTVNLTGGTMFSSDLTAAQNPDNWTLGGTGIPESINSVVIAPGARTAAITLNANPETGDVLTIAANTNVFADGIGALPSTPIILEVAPTIAEGGIRMYAQSNEISITLSTGSFLYGVSGAHLFVTAGQLAAEVGAVTGVRYVDARNVVLTTANSLTRIDGLDDSEPALAIAAGAFGTGTVGALGFTMDASAFNLVRDGVTAAHLDLTAPDLGGRTFTLELVEDGGFTPEFADIINSAHFRLTDDGTATTLVEAEFGTATPQFSITRVSSTEISITVLGTGGTGAAINSVFEFEIADPSVFANGFLLSASEISTGASSAVEPTAVIVVDTQPIATHNVVQGEISGNMVVVVSLHEYSDLTAPIARAATIVWMAYDGDDKAGASAVTGGTVDTVADVTTGTIAIPTGLTSALGPHHFFARITTAGAASVDSVSVTINVYGCACELAGTCNCAANECDCGAGCNRTNAADQACDCDS